jgi:hypothetical protein
MWVTGGVLGLVAATALTVTGRASLRRRAGERVGR